MANCIEQVESTVEPVDFVADQSIRSFDMLGIAASTICLIHCLAMPFLISFLPLFGWQFLEGKLAHQMLAGFVVMFAIFGIIPGYLRHRHPKVLVGMAFGLLFVMVATWVCGWLMPESAELPLITVGNLILVATHWHNHHLASCSHHVCKT